MDRVLVSPTVSVISQIVRGDAEPDVVMSDCCCFRSHFGFWDCNCGRMLQTYQQNIHIQPHNEIQTERGESERVNNRFTWAETLHAATFGHSCIFTYEPSSLSHTVIMITGLCCSCCRPLIWIPLPQNKQAQKKNPFPRDFTVINR